MLTGAACATAFVRWGGSYQTEVVSREAYERLAADPNILLKD